MDKDREYKIIKDQCTNESEEPIIFGEGKLYAKIILVGEAPGAKEIEIGRPFVGQAGKNLDAFLEVVDIERKDLYITNVVKIRPYRVNEKTGRKVNRPPSIIEIEKFSKYLFKEIEIIGPDLIVTLGNVPLKTLMKMPNATIGKHHGEIQISDGRTIFPLYHPAAVIYNRSLKETYLEDLLKLKEYIKGNIKFN